MQAGDSGHYLGSSASTILCWEQSRVSGPRLGFMENHHKSSAYGLRGVDHRYAAFSLIAGVGTPGPSPIRSLYILATNFHPSNLSKIFDPHNFEAVSF